MPIVNPTAFARAKKFSSPFVVTLSIAELLNISVSAASDMRFKQMNLSDEELESLAKLLGCSPQSLLDVDTMLERMATEATQEESIKRVVMFFCALTTLAGDVASEAVDRSDEQDVLRIIKKARDDVVAIILHPVNK